MAARPQPSRGPGPIAPGRGLVAYRISSTLYRKGYTTMETQDYRRLQRRGDAVLHKLLGDLELEIMELMWERKQATVRDIVMQLRPTRPRAYTTIMTVMFHLAEKDLLH